MTITATAPLTRVLNEGYGPGAWHGADLKASFDEVTPELAFWRPGEGRHNIAEIALHHAYTARNVRGKISGRDPEPFALEGDDWFTAEPGGRLSWPEIRTLVDAEQTRLADAVASVQNRGADVFDLVLGITCHAIYHAGQIQLIKKLR
jgi:hypothetical protein